MVVMHGYTNVASGIYSYYLTPSPLLLPSPSLSCNVPRDICMQINVILNTLHTDAVFIFTSVIMNI